MRTLHLYLTRQVLLTLLMTVAVFTFVLLLGNVLKEILGLLVNRQASLGLVARAIGLLIPYVLSFALPMGMLTATLLVFGRFSADNELTAVRGSGISVVSLCTPLLLLACGLSLLCAVINLELAPRCRIAYKRLVDRVDVTTVQNFLPERTFIREFTNYTAFFGKVEGSRLEDIWLYRMDKARTNVDVTFRAPRGSVEADLTNRRLVVTLQDVSAIYLDAEQSDRQPVFMTSWTIPIDISVRAEKAASVDEMTFRELQRKRRDLEAQHVTNTLPIEVEMHAQVAFSFACIGFTLIGIPLGIRAHRRETSAGIAMAMVLVMVYYSFLVLAQSLESKPAYAPHLIVWLPNFLFQAVGIVLLRRVNRGL